VNATELLRFSVAGTPVPQGSKKAWFNPKTQRTMMTEAQGARLSSWRSHITAAAMQAKADAGLTDKETGPIAIRLTFKTLRGTGHYGSGRNEQQLKPSAPSYPAKAPDYDKLARAINDALTDAGVWVDDGQVVDAHERKVWVDRFTGTEGVDIVIYRIND
jgi:Holliday junction resolvase RusA-like endonuclease